MKKKSTRERNKPGVLAVPIRDFDHRQGRLDAPISIVEYADFECPYCAEADQIMKEIQDRIGDRLCFVFRSFPLSDAHAHAEHAAESAEAAAAQGRFWEMHDLLFERQDALEDQDLAEYAAELAINMERFFEEMENGLYTERVQEELRGGIRCGVTGTPTFFINGRLHRGEYDFHTLMRALTEPVAA